MAPQKPRLDILLLSLIIWGDLKSVVYRNNPSTLIELRENVRQEIQAIGPEILQRVFLNLGVRLEECQQKNGVHLDNVIFEKLIPKELSIIGRKN